MACKTPDSMDYAYIPSRRELFDGDELCAVCHAPAVHWFKSLGDNEEWRNRYRCEECVDQRMVVAHMLERLP